MMSQPDPARSDYLAIVSEWSSPTRNGGLVGNAYPIFNLTKRQEVASPEEEFPNPGAVFLTSRGSLNTWDFVVLRPRANERYQNSTDRDCYYIPSGYATVLNHPDHLESVAVILDHPTFDLTANTRQLQNPAHNVTPYFFVQRAETLFGPLVRDVFLLSPADDVQRIDWRPAGDDGIVHEFTRAELLGQDIHFVEYAHPNPRNRVVEPLITMAVGKIREAHSGKPHDTLPIAALIDWYLRRCPTAKLPIDTLSALRAAFRAETTDAPTIVTARLRKIEREMAIHAAFAEQRDRFAREYLESDAGRQRVQELIDQTVKKKASEIQGEVDKKEQALAARRDELAHQLQAADDEHRQLLQSLQSERNTLTGDITELKAAAADLQDTLSQDARTLAIKMREQIPLIAALVEGQRDAQGSIEGAAGAGTGSGRPVDFRPVPPSKPIIPTEDEKKFVEDLHADLAGQGLNFARDFVANVYICLKAEYLNLIIGPPGYGKSMLVAALARSLGHADALLRIAVRRSWAEDRHLLGFFDSFNKRYDAGPTGLVPRMLQAEADWRADRVGAYVVLLDEFNLAAPEYYFAQLLQVLPSDDPIREVTLYDPAGATGDGFPPRITLAPNLRFWGTINYDETTERLSPRTLDRTGMIFLGEADVRPTLAEESTPAPGVSGKDLFGTFLRGLADCPDDRWELVSPVIDLLRSPDVGLGPRVELSPRVQKGIRRYLANSVGVLDPRVAADFVVQQRILPVVRGRGDEFLARVRRLLVDELEKKSLGRSARHVEDALRRSEMQFGDLDFLSY